jgi:hypothetical protein
MSGIGATGRYRPPYQEPDRFGVALIAALLLEAAATLVSFLQKKTPTIA